MNGPFFILCSRPSRHTRRVPSRNATAKEALAGLLCLTLAILLIGTTLYFALQSIAREP
jgi:hypothetical protein